MIKWTVRFDGNDAQLIFNWESPPRLIQLGDGSLWTLGINVDNLKRAENTELLYQRAAPEVISWIHCVPVGGPPPAKDD